MVGHLRIERSAGSVSESPGQPARHDPQCRRRDLLPRGGPGSIPLAGRGLMPLPLPVGATSACARCGARGSNSPGSACRAGVLARGLAPRIGSGGRTRTLVSALQRRASWPLDHSGTAVAADGFEPSRSGLWGPASSRERSGSGGRIRTDGLLVMSQASCLCSSPHHAK